MKYARKTFLVILAMAIMMVVSVSAHAAARWSYLTTIAADLGFDSNGYAFVSVMCDADANDVDKISVKCELQQYDGGWNTIKTWTETKNSSAIMFDKEYAVAKGYSYRLKITASVYSDPILLEKVTGEYAQRSYR